MIFNAKTRLAGVIGWPVSHSLSPRLHGYWLERYAIDGAYLPLAVRPEGLAAAIAGLAAAGFAGANVTVPHKQAAIALCDMLSPFARRVGAVNTLVFQEGRIAGSNSDGAGFVANLRDHAIDLRGPALVLGAGGAARAVAAALQEAGAAVTVSGRDAGKAAALAGELGVASLPWAARDGSLGAFGLLVNATAAGMAGATPLDFDLTRAAAGLVVHDIVYAPRQTVLLRTAAALGLRTVEGIGMLLHQAVPGFTAWYGRVPEVDQALRDWLLAG